MRGDPRCYVLDGVGGFRVGGIISRRATADADGEIWHFKRRGRAAKATDKTSLVAGVYVPIAVGRGGVLRWGERELALRAVGFEAGAGAGTP